MALPPIPASASAPIPAVLRDHVVAAGTRWWRRGLDAAHPGVTGAAITAGDDLLFAHLDGLVHGGAAAWAEVKAAFAATPDAEHGFVLLAVGACGGVARRAAALDLLDAAPVAAWEGAWHAPAWLALPAVAPLLETAATPPRRALALAVVREHGPEAHPLVAAGLADTEPLVVAEAVAAACRRWTPAWTPLVAAHLASPATELRFAAARTLALRAAAGPERTAALEALGALCTDAGYGELAIDVLARVLDPPVMRAWIDRTRDDPAWARRVVRACSACGDPADLPWLAERAADAALGRLAGAAWSLITGIDVVRAGWAQVEVGEGADGDLPVPDATALVRAAPGLVCGRRHLAGAPLDAAVCRAAWHAGNGWERAAAALELARLDPGPMPDARSARVR